MSRRSKPPRLWFRPARADGRGAAYFILDRGKQISTGFGIDGLAGAEKALVRYLNSKRLDRPSSRDPEEILIDDVLTRYVRDVAKDHARPHETAIRIRHLSAFFGGQPLSYITGETCRRYAETRSTLNAARRELEDLRAAINHHRTEGLCDKIVSVVLPSRRQPRERWLTRSEAARLVLRARRYREHQNYRATNRATRKHIARFILVALYTGSRAGVVCSASFEREPGRAWIDLDHGVLYRRPADHHQETKKRRPPVRLPPELIGHLRRWRAAGAQYAVEWNGRPIERVTRAFQAACRDAGFGADVTPHTLRHTAATWLMQRGVSLWDAAGYLGMTVETLERNYGHHHPDFQRGARASFGAHRSTERQ